MFRKFSEVSMNKLVLLLVLVVFGMPAGFLMADTANTPETGYLQCSSLNLLGGNDTTWGAVNIFYDDARKTMVIRIRSSNNSPTYAGQYFYCRENENPKFYNLVYTIVERHLASWDNYITPSQSGSHNWSNYRALSLWFKTISSTNMIKGISPHWEG
jgi:hypothetical protein